MVKRCCVGRCKHYSDLASVQVDWGFVSQQHFLIFFCSTVGYSKAKCQSLTCYVHTQAHRGWRATVLVISSWYTNTKALCVWRRPWPPLLIHSSAEFLSCQPSKISPSRLLHDYTPVPLQIVPKYTKPTDCSKVLSKNPQHCIFEIHILFLFYVFF